MLEYIDLGPYLPTISNLNKMKPKDSFIGEVVISIDHTSLMSLMDNVDALFSYIDQGSILSLSPDKYAEIREDLKKLASLLKKAQRIYLDFGSDDKLNRSLRNIIELIRVNYHLIMAVEFVVPGALKIDYKFRGTDFYPVIYTVAF
jgi:hypothetical protein